jgi:hypothetical protein
MRRGFTPIIVGVAVVLSSSAATADVPRAKSPEAVLQEAHARQATGAYQEAADGYEAFARSSPAGFEAFGALETAIALRLVFGQADIAGADAKLLVARFGKIEPARAARASLSVCDYEVDHANPGAAGRLTAWVAAFGETAPLDARIHAQALLGRAAAKGNDAAAARAAYTRVLEFWRDPEAAQRTLAAEGGDSRRLGTTLMDVGEALFFGAEQKKKDADAIHYPEYRGPATREKILAHLNTKVTEWVRQKRPAIEAAEREYKKIFEIQPAAPPKWMVRAASRVGVAWGKFVAEFRAAPIPSEWKGNGPVPGTTLTYDEIRREYYARLDEASAPQKETAKGAFKTCLAISVKYAYADEFSQACEQWLSKNYPGESTTANAPQKAPDKPSVAP